MRTRKEQESIELELGVGMAGDEEGEIAYIQHLLEKEVVVSNLLGAFVPLILNICARGSSVHVKLSFLFRIEILSPTAVKQDDLVKECAILALCKYMCVSSSFCEQNLQLLFSLLSPHTSTCDEESQRLRANIVIAVGDLAFRFPNLLEPWTKHIYQPLSVLSFHTSLLPSNAHHYHHHRTNRSKSSEMRSWCSHIWCEHITRMPIHHPASH